MQVRVPAVNQDLCPWDLLLMTHVCEEGRRGDWGRETADICIYHESNSMGAYTSIKDESRCSRCRDGVLFPLCLLSLRGCHRYMHLFSF